MIDSIAFLPIYSSVCRASIIAFIIGSIIGAKLFTSFLSSIEVKNEEAAFRVETFTLTSLSTNPL